MSDTGLEHEPLLDTAFVALVSNEQPDRALVQVTKRNQYMTARQHGKNARIWSGEQRS